MSSANMRPRLLWSALLIACGSSGKPVPASSTSDSPPGAASPSSGPRATDDVNIQSGDGAGTRTDAPSYQTSRRALVQWKRYAALEADLMSALKLSPEQVCTELGDQSCVRDVHLVSLGGNEPYVSGLMKPSSEPLATTPSVVDRVLLSACSARVRLDAAGDKQVFMALDLHGPVPPRDDPSIASTIGDLYRKLLARDPEAREVELVAQLADDSAGERMSAQDFAALACFTIGSTTEFLFF
ncbi:MAG TPA: hypothetical protein VFQ61_20850 [Polyangiaceae bacterium]|nr:hypothetical protein [Polyangiaceae bacterium]